MSRSVLGSAARIRNGRARIVPSRRGTRPASTASSRRLLMRPASTVAPTRIPKGIPMATRMMTRLATMSPIGPSPSARPTPLSVVAAIRAMVNPTTKPSSVAPIRANRVRMTPGCFPPVAADTRPGSG